jgi:prevent-host-death family protein
MNVEVDYHQFQNESDDFLDRVEEGQIVVITQAGRPIADLIPHREGEARRLDPDEVE